jgi:hypothetical protein
MPGIFGRQFTRKQHRYTLYLLREGIPVASNSPTASAKIETGDFNAFTEFARRVVSVPHAAIKAQLDAEKTAKRPTASRSSGVPTKKS